MVTNNKSTLNRVKAVIFLLLILSSVYVPVVLAEAAGAPTPT